MNIRAKDYGKITVNYTVWCAKCNEWDMEAGCSIRCKKAWKAKGWTFTKVNGWRCPECSKK